MDTIIKEIVGLEIEEIMILKFMFFFNKLWGCQLLMTQLMGNFCFLENKIIGNFFCHHF
jgi:hypothetical protein